MSDILKAEDWKVLKGCDMEVRRSCGGCLGRVLGSCSRFVESLTIGNVEVVRVMRAVDRKKEARTRS